MYVCSKMFIFRLHQCVCAIKFCNVYFHQGFVLLHLFFEELALDLLAFLFLFTMLNLIFVQCHKVIEEHSSCAIFSTCNSST